LTLLTNMVRQASQRGRALCFRYPAKRGIYVLFPLLLLSLANASVAQTPAKVSIAYSAISPIFAGVWMAKEIGAFEKQGLKAELVYISSGSVTVQAMVGGNLDMSIAASNAVVSSILRGAPLVAVGSITNRPAMSLFVQSEISQARATSRQSAGDNPARFIDTFFDALCARKTRSA
jgi:ABC-type nitrate/sulfonate/bicarbonate transport system substrate-binding protein